MGEGEIVHYEQFLLFPLCFQEIVLQTRKNQGLFGKGLTNDEITDWMNLKAFADDNLNVNELMISVYDRIENIVNRGENTGHQHFLLSHNVFK